MSIAGGYWKAVEAASAAGCDCVQLFTKNNNQWRAKPISDQDVGLFRDALARFNISHPLSHASYLINLASPDDALREKSVEGMAEELKRAALLGIPNVVVHPGAFTTASLEQGLQLAAQSLLQVLEKTDELTTAILLENTAGQGSTLGSQFAELATMLNAVDRPDRMGVCIDTCHAFAAGYDLTTDVGYRKMVSELAELLSLPMIKAIHLNDSKKRLGSRVDRHEHIGLGQLGDRSFCRLLNDARFASVPMYLETEKGDCDGEDWDVLNLKRLRQCFAS